MEYGYNIQWYDWQANTNQYTWARNPYEDLKYKWYVNYSKSGSTTGFFNECGSLAKWMVDNGWRVDITKGFQEVQPGDIIFFSEKMKYNNFPMSFETLLEGYDYRGITHAAICTSATSNYESFVGPINVKGTPVTPGIWSYAISVICPPSFMEQYLRNTSGGWNSNYDTSYDIREFALEVTWEYTNSQNLTYCLPSMDTIAMVCRPDLSTNQKTYLEQEAENLGLHTVPENETQLNIIKRCRLCTDIEWTPGIDYARPMPITGLSNKYNGNLASYWYFPEFADSLMVNGGTFNSDLCYLGLPFIKTGEDLDTGSPSLLQINQFISIINNEHAPLFNTAPDDPTSNESYPFYGWKHPKDFIGFVFGEDSIRDIIITDWYTYEFRKEKFEVIDGDFDEDSVDPEWMEPVRMGDFDWNTLKLGDIVAPFNFGDPNTYSAIGIITDIIKDSNNNIQSVELSEATRYGLLNPKNADLQDGNVICRKIYSKDEFEQWYNLFPEVGV